MALSQGCNDVVLQTVPALETWYCGNVKAAPSGKAGVVQNMKPAVAGESVSLKVRGRVTQPTTLAHTAGADVFVNTTTQAVVAAAGAGIVTLGKAVYTVTASPTGSVEVDLDPAY